MGQPHSANELYTRLCEDTSLLTWNCLKYMDCIMSIFLGNDKVQKKTLFGWKSHGSTFEYAAASMI
jgi:hypothetical protein